MTSKLSSSILFRSAFVFLFFSLYADSSPSSLQFTHDLHPLHSLPGMSNSHIKPVVVRSYGFHRRFFGQASDQAIFSPGSASYLHFDSGQPFITNADALVPFIHWPDGDHHSTYYGRVELNHKARVFAILWAFRTFFHDPPANFAPTLKGAPDSWKVIGAVRTVSGEWDVLGDEARWTENGKKDMLSLPNVGLAVELPPIDDENSLNFTIPHPWKISIDNEGVSRIALIFVPDQVSNKYVDLQSFPKPKLPKAFREFPIGVASLKSKRKIIRPKLEPPSPNFVCPDWLHDVYVTRSHLKLSEMTRDEPRYWQTWHPIVDPIYWCYFEHEHGSFPGVHYKPLFGYTAFKTRDRRTSHGRQDESHEGFKIISVPLEDNRLMVMTVHIHASQPRRFIVRRHTVILAVIGAEGELEMEISMKSDFGPAKAGMASGTSEPFTSKDEKIDRILRERLGISAGRTFNVLNIDGNFPDSLDTKYRFKGSISRGPESMLGGFYEQWKTTLNSCTTPRNQNYGDFQVDVRDPSTAARSTYGGDSEKNIQKLNGIGVKRFLVVNKPGIIISEKFCTDGMQNRSDDGVIFTDSYMRRTFKGKGRFKVRQYIKNGLKDVEFKSGIIQAWDPWDAIYFRDDTGATGSHNIEKAVNRVIN